MEILICQKEIKDFKTLDDIDIWFHKAKQIGLYQTPNKLRRLSILSFARI